MRRSCLTLLWCLFLVTPPLSSAENDNLADIDPAKIAAIKELMTITGAEANRSELSDSFSQQLISVLQANNVKLDDHAKEIIQQEVDQVVAEELANRSLQNRMVRIYARYFTLEELQGLIAFNRSAIGSKANRVMPTLMRESMNAAQSWSVDIGPDITARVRKRLNQEGIDLNQ